MTNEVGTRIGKLVKQLARRDVCDVGYILVQMYTKIARCYCCCIVVIWGKAMTNYPQKLAQDAVCQSHTGHMTGLWFLPARPLRLNTNEMSGHMINTCCVFWEKLIDFVQNCCLL